MGEDRILAGIMDSMEFSLEERCKYFYYRKIIDKNFYG